MDIVKELEGVIELLSPKADEDIASKSSCERLEIVKEYLENAAKVSSPKQEEGTAIALPSPANDFKEIVKGMIETFVKKNHDYGNSFESSCNEEGLAAARIRLGDKWLRFKKLSKGEEALVKDESIRDTLLDMANYCVMTIMWMNNQKKCDNA